MPCYPPPTKAPGRAKTTVLPAGTSLYRVHSSAFAPDDFNPTDPGAAPGGGRFDSPARQPPYLYAALTSRTAIAEALLRSVPFDARGVRQLPRAALRAKCLSELRTTAPMRLVALHGEGLGRLGQDVWLVHCNADEYGATREWGAAIMRWNPSAAGLTWRPRHDDDGLAICLYQDRLTGCLDVVRMVALAEGEGRALVRSALVAFGVAPP